MPNDLVHALPLHCMFALSISMVRLCTPFLASPNFFLPFESRNTAHCKADYITLLITVLETFGKSSTISLSQLLHSKADKSRGNACLAQGSLMCMHLVGQLADITGNLSLSACTHVVHTTNACAHAIVLVCIVYTNSLKQLSYTHTHTHAHTRSHTYHKHTYTHTDIQYPH